MARGGINKALVQKARQAILARGENPSIDAIRVELGNTGSKTTIHRYLKELEDADRGRNAAALPLSEQLANLVAQLADQLKEEAQADMAQEREQLARERLDYQNQIRQAESRIQQLEGQRAGLTEQFQAAQQALLQEQQLRQQAEVENARLQQANHDQEARLQDRDGQIRSLEDKHQHARDAL
ncbi:DNA-binding protein, partial [Pseudomonas aeruginosa]